MCNGTSNQVHTVIQNDLVWGSVIGVDLLMDEVSNFLLCGVLNSACDWPSGCVINSCDDPSVSVWGCWKMADKVNTPLFEWMDFQVNEVLCPLLFKVLLQVLSNLAGRAVLQV